jgi:hypothetical protein
MDSVSIRIIFWFRLSLVFDIKRKKNILVNQLFQSKDRSKSGKNKKKNRVKQIEQISFIMGRNSNSEFRNIFPKSSSARTYVATMVSFYVHKLWTHSISFRYIFDIGSMYFRDKRFFFQDNFGYQIF